MLGVTSRAGEVPRGSVPGGAGPSLSPGDPSTPDLRVGVSHAGHRCSDMLGKRSWGAEVGEPVLRGLGEG